MKYPYLTYPFVDERGRIIVIKRPIVEIEVFGPKGVASVLALIDSGADRSLFHISVAQRVGLDLTGARKTRMVGIVGAAETLILDEVEIKIQRLRSRVKIPVGFIDSPHVGALLGQEGFFDQFRITFEKARDTFTITSIRG